MAYNPLELLNFCKLLCGQTNNTNVETNCRVVVSRAYYAAFLHSREYLREKHHIHFSGTGDDHIFVEKQLKLCLPQNRILSSIIRELRENRGAADYDLNSPARAISYFSAVARRYRTLKFDQITQTYSINRAEFLTNSLHR
jgi:hypothetical protein